MNSDDNMEMVHPYQGRTLVITTQHAKESILRPILANHLGINLVCTTGVDTDLLGTFNGEVRRVGSPTETAIQKARLGIEATGIPIGLASEGSFGPHPQLPFFNADQEIMVLVDTERQIVIEESVVSTATNVGEINVASIEEAEEFLAKSLFGTHAVIVRPNCTSDPHVIQKGIVDRYALSQTIKQYAGISPDGLAHLETDMRAHLNPTRRKVIEAAAEKLAVRIRAQCPECGTPGWGVVDVIMGLPCEGCAEPTHLVHKEILGCVKCRFRKVTSRSDAKKSAPAHLCPHCNP
jgi:hypothetical protein